MDVVDEHEDLALGADTAPSLRAHSAVSADDTPASHLQPEVWSPSALRSVRTSKLQEDKERERHKIGKERSRRCAVQCSFASRSERTSKEKVRKEWKHEKMEKVKCETSESKR